MSTLRLNEHIKNIADKHAEKLEELTRDQFEECLLEAINSGDFMRHVQRSDINISKEGSITNNSRYGMTYVPYREKVRLEKKIEELSYEIYCLKRYGNTDFLKRVNRIFGED